MNLCLFSSYSDTDKIANYIKVYLKELRRYHDRIIFITNDRILVQADIDFLSEINVGVLFVENHGYDFGMWRKAIEIIDINQVTRLSLINDSCLLVRSLEKTFLWLESCEYDYCGIASSKERALHIQSYFLIIKKPCLSTVFNYFKINGILEDLQQVVDVYEIGLSEHLVNKGFSIGSMFGCDKYRRVGQENISLYSAKELLEDGCPTLKKKIAFGTFRPIEAAALKMSGFDFSFDYKRMVQDILCVNDSIADEDYLFA